MTFYYWKNGWTLDISIWDLLLGRHKPQGIRSAISSRVRLGPVPPVLSVPEPLYWPF